MKFTREDANSFSLVLHESLEIRENYFPSSSETQNGSQDVSNPPVIVLRIDKEDLVDGETIEESIQGTIA